MSEFAYRRFELFLTAQILSANCFIKICIYRLAYLGENYKYTTLSIHVARMATRYEKLSINSRPYSVEDPSKYVPTTSAIA